MGNTKLGNYKINYPHKDWATSISLVVIPSNLDLTTSPKKSYSYVAIYD